MAFKRKFFENQSSPALTSSIHLLGYYTLTIHAIGNGAGAQGTLNIERSIDEENWDVHSVNTLSGTSSAVMINDPQSNWPYWRFNLSAVASGQFDVWIFAQQQVR